MKKGLPFIRKLNLQYSRKLRFVPLPELAKRFIIDSNAHVFEAFSEDTGANQWGIVITKSKGKYVIDKWSNFWDDTDVVKETKRVVSDYRKVIDIINDAVSPDSYDVFFIKDKHRNNVDWQIIRDPSDLYDDEEEADYGELPKGFEPLEAIPETLSI